MKLRTLFLLISFASVGCERSLSHSQAESATANEGGYYSLDNPRVPRKVAGTADSIFRVVVPLEQDSVAVNYILGTNYLYRMFLNFVDDDSMIKTVLLKEIEACDETQGFFNWRNTPCKVSYRFALGTAFLARDGHTLWTAAHVLNEGLRFPEGFGDHGFWPVYVFDRNGELQVDPNVEKLTPAVMPAGARTPVATPIPRLASSDYIAIALTHDLGAPLAVAAQLPAPNERIYTAGFPACTGCIPSSGKKSYDSSDRSPNPNSSGHELLVSMGRFELSDPQGVLRTTVDMVPGNSGGPALNQDGEVIGIASMTGADAEFGSLQRDGIFVDPQELHTRISAQK